MSKDYTEVDEPECYIYSLLRGGETPGQIDAEVTCSPEQNLAIELIVGGLINVQNKPETKYAKDLIWESDLNWAMGANTGFEIWCGIIDIDPDFVRKLFTLAVRGKLTNLNL